MYLSCFEKKNWNTRTQKKLQNSENKVYKLNIIINVQLLETISHYIYLYIRFNFFSIECI